MSFSLNRNKNNEINSFNHAFNKNISSQIKFLTTKNEKTENKNADIISLNKNKDRNINSINQKSDEINSRKQSVGINTSTHYENKKWKKKSIGYIKPKVFNSKPYSDLFKKYIISYSDLNRIKPKPLNETKIPKIKPKKIFNTISVSHSKRVKKIEDNKILPLKTRKKESLFTYNFVKDAYSEEERLLLNISNNNYETLDKVKFYNRLKKAKSKKNFKTLIYSINDLKSMRNKNKKNKKFKTFNMTNFFHQNPNFNSEINDSIKDIKNSFCNSLLKDIFSKEGNQTIKEENKSIKRNLKYDRVPGDEINIRTNLFCIKNKNNNNLNL